MEMLQRVRVEQQGAEVADDVGNADGTDGIPPIEELLEGIDLDGLRANSALSLDDLSSSQLRAFERAVRAGRLSHVIKSWSAWWLRPMVEVVDGGSKLDSEELDGDAANGGNNDELIASRCPAATMVCDHRPAPHGIHDSAWEVH